MSQVPEEAASGPVLTGPVLVGVDGSEQSLSALSWADREATLRRAPLHIVCVLSREARPTDLGTASVAADSSVSGPNVTPAQQAERDIREVMGEFMRQRVATANELHLLYGDPSQLLVELAFRLDAGLIVLGRRGLGTFKLPLLGSVSGKCAAYAPCPVLVVRDGPPAWARTAVVGVDVEAASDAAVIWGADWASRAGGGVLAAGAWQAPSLPLAASATLLPELQEVLREAAEDAVVSAMDAVRHQFPGVEALPMIREGDPASVLCSAAAEPGSAVLVVGSGGSGSRAIGSVARRCLEQSPGAVVIVRDSVQKS